jgi:hypothetical protein
MYQTSEDSSTSTQLHKAGVPLGFRRSLPGQDLVDLGQNEQGPLAI